MKMRAIGVDEAHSLNVELFAVVEANVFFLHYQPDWRVVFNVQQLPAENEDDGKFVNRTAITDTRIVITCSSHGQTPL